MNWKAILLPSIALFALLYGVESVSLSQYGENMDGTGDSFSLSAYADDAEEPIEEETAPAESETAEASEEIQSPTDNRITFKTLRKTVLKKDPPPEFDESLYPLDGKEVEIIGFMAPYDDLKSMTNFLLMPTVQGCYFCEIPYIEEVVMVRLAKKDMTGWISNAIKVTGTLDLWKQDSEDKAHKGFLYIIQDAEYEIYHPDEDDEIYDSATHNG